MKKRPKPWYEYYDYLKAHLGAVTYKVSVQGGFTCPNIDGSVARGGCTYCNNSSFVPAYLADHDSITAQIDHGIASQARRYGARKFLAYFQSYSNTYAPVDELARRYEQALEHPGVAGLVIGTRADCLEPPVVALLEELASRCYLAVEIGIESVYDQTLRRINRGHDIAVVEQALARLQGKNIHLGGHLIVGFPWETRDQQLATARTISAWPLDYVKWHHLQVVRGTAMAVEYRQHPFALPSFEAWVPLVCDLLERLRPDMAVARLCGSAPPHLLLAPQWGRKKHAEVIQAVMQEFDKRGTRQGARSTLPAS